MDRYQIDVDQANTVRIWDNENPNEFGAPFILQPDHPDGRPWQDQTEAEAWAQRLISELEPSVGAE